MEVKSMHSEEIKSVVSSDDAQLRLGDLLDQTSSEHEPLLIKGPKSNAVLMAEEDWNSLQETLYLLSVPGMRESLLEAARADNAEFSTSLDW